MREHKSVTDFLSAYNRREPVRFHMPGHKGRYDLYERYGFGDFAHNMIGSDITEIPGADALTQPRESLKDLMEDYAALYGVRHTELLVNGSSAGLIASILLTVPRGGRILIGRNSHKSVFAGMRLGGVEPVYVEPEIDPETGLQCGISPESVRQALEEAPDVSAVLITSPNYYGVLSDIGAIARICHEQDKILIVDQAHGAHLKFFDYIYSDSEPVAAEDLGADLVVNSTHKTLLSFTSSSILNVCSERIDIDELAELLRMLQTTSPSYLLMGSLEVNQKIMRLGSQELINNWRKDISWFYQKSKSVPGLEVLMRDDMDLTKINLSLRRYGIDGDQLQDELIRRNVWPELVHGDYAMMMTSVGNKREDYEALLTALRDIIRGKGMDGRNGLDGQTRELPKPTSIPNHAPLEQRPIPTKKEIIPLYKAEGRVLYDTIIPYPPGVPAACPGEVLSYELITWLRNRLSHDEIVIGIDEEGCVAVGAEEPENTEE